MKKLWMAALVVITAGCSGNATLSTRVGAASAGSALTVGTVNVTRVRMVVLQVEVERGDEQDEVEFEAGPYLLDLSGAELEGGVVAQFTAEVPAGTYDELEFEIHPLEGTLPEDEAMREMFSRGASVIIDGDVGGTPFSYESHLTEKREIEGTFDLGAGGDNLTLNIDPSGWFIGENGTALDPNDPEHASQIEANIKLSLDAYDDDDHDGDDDDAS